MYTYLNLVLAKQTTVRMEIMSLVVMTELLYSSHVLAATAPSTSQEFVLNGTNVGVEFDGHGGLSAGGTTRQLLDYPERYRSEILDYVCILDNCANDKILCPHFTSPSQTVFTLQSCSSPVLERSSES